MKLKQDKMAYLLKSDGNKSMENRELRKIIRIRQAAVHLFPIKSNHSLFSIKISISMSSLGQLTYLLLPTPTFAYTNHPSKHTYIGYILKKSLTSKVIYPITTIRPNF